MKHPLDLSLLTIPRLKAYRKSLLKKKTGYEVCDCGSSGCDFRMKRNINKPDYIFYCEELERVNTVLAARQMKVYREEHRNDWAQIPLTVKEEQKMFPKRRR